MLSLLLPFHVSSQKCGYQSSTSVGEHSAFDSKGHDCNFLNRDSLSKKKRVEAGENVEML